MSDKSLSADLACVTFAVCMLALIVLDQDTKLRKLRSQFAAMELEWFPFRAQLRADRARETMAPPAARPAAKRAAKKTAAKASA